jgi:hypothetical protein
MYQESSLEVAVRVQKGIKVLRFSITKFRNVKIKDLTFTVLNLRPEVGVDGVEVHCGASGTNVM